MRTMIAGAALAALLAGPALAQGGTAPPPAPTAPAPQGTGAGAMPMPMPMAAAGADTPSTTAFKSAMAGMEHGMNVPYTGDADRDFVSGMIPHHEGAVAMAQVELKYGKDPALKKLARDIVAAQRREIGFMQRWQAAHTPK